MIRLINASLKNRVNLMQLILIEITLFFIIVSIHSVIIFHKNINYTPNTQAIFRRQGKAGTLGKNYFLVY